MTCGGTCQRTVLLAVRDVLEDAENPNSTILFRPDDVAHRRQFGHWEGDLMLWRALL